MLGWADCAWLPFMYTLQCGYLMNNPNDIGIIPSVLILVMGIIGYIIFRVANFQKDYFRKTLQGKYIECEYTTSDGKLHTSRLIYSGLWGYARHLNYTGDIILSFAYCLPCGFSHILPYFYGIYMCILLGTRCIRDEDRCQKKYGFKWNQYCKKVPYRYMPGII
jgi:7-dehydrocholesterol reductase